MESSGVIGFGQEQALTLLKRLLRCGYPVTWQKLDGFSDRYCILLPFEHNPQFATRLLWASQVEAACSARLHLPLSVVALGAAEFSAKAAVIGQSVLPGVR